MHISHRLLVLLSLVLPVIAAEPTALEKLPARIGGASVDVTFADGTTQRTHLKGTHLANGGTLRIGAWRGKVVPCREVATLKYEPSTRAFARGVAGFAFAVGFSWASIRFAGQATPVLLPFGAPLAGTYGAFRLVPRRPQTLSPICP